MKGKKVSLNEVMLIINMKNDGKSYKDISAVTGRSVRSVENILHRYRVSGNLKPVNSVQQAEEEFLKDVPVIDEEVIGKIVPLQSGEQPGFVQTLSDKPKKKVVQTVTKTLNDYSASELFKNLYERGYRFDEANIYCIVKKQVSVNDMLGL